jgi:hypothetical protein
MVAADCLERTAPELTVGELIEFRNPDGTTYRFMVAGVEFFDPPNLDRPFAVPLPRGTPRGSVQIGAEVWASAEGAGKL